MYQIRFFKIGGHFCQQLIGRNTDIYCEAKCISYMLPDMVGSGFRSLTAVFKRYVGHKTFINAVGPDIR